MNDDIISATASLEAEIDSLKEERNKLLSKIKKYKDALEFYADPDNYILPNFISSINFDKGRIAKKALLDEK